MLLEQLALKSGNTTTVSGSSCAFIFKNGKHLKSGNKVDFIFLKGMAVEQQKLFLSPEGNCGKRIEALRGITGIIKGFSK